ncbi:putative RNA-directed DNA polymerase from transposon BS [Labeo rohita]|uniref:RNA-directed DNA polymerase from transposon BS n=1 Tax=Labeo rohita TaxID=84645 RepID=A0ABQ8LBX2_LABRO|nr:putative RNA-directed DNA polymerase from transposon BS [Labeo rohita]
MIRNNNNPRILFRTINQLLHFSPASNGPVNASLSICEEFATFFNEKMTDIRSSISKTLGPIQDPALFSPQYTMNSFNKINKVELHKILSCLGNATCVLDPIPTYFFKEVIENIFLMVLDIVNLSLATGVFPETFKTAVIKPQLKKHNLDSSVLSNYRPISNIPFMSKILEKAVFRQINDFLMGNNIYEKFQSGFRQGHSTETALVKVVNDLRISMDINNISVLVLLDLSAAFDTVDHDILLNRLKEYTGLTGTVLNWFKTYLKGRKYFISLGDHVSGVHDIHFGVPQGSVLGPLLFSLYMLPLGKIIAEHGVSFHSYADDTQLCVYISVGPEDPGAVNKLVNCLAGIVSWMNRHFLKLNEDKSEILLVGNELQRKKVLNSLGNLALQTKTEVKNLGVILDSELTFKAHIDNVVKTAFFHLRNIARVRPFLNFEDAKKLTHAFIFSHLDYCNALLIGLPKKTIERLQLVQNAAARVVTHARKFAHITPIFADLHWLPVSFRIDYKILLLVFKALNGQAPLYISECLTVYIPNRSLRSSGSTLLNIPMAKYKKYGQAAFCFYAPKTWNKLPINIRQASSLKSS